MAAASSATASAGVAVDPPKFREHPYRHRGVHIPFVEADNNNQWSLDDDIQKRGFIFANTLLKGHIFCVQSVENGQIYANKIMEPDTMYDPDQNPRRPEEQAEELRISTAPQAEHRLIGPLTVRGIRRTYFSELDLWQDIGNGTYSLYFKFYNGGSLEELRHRYIDEQRAISEHFIWHVFLTLIEAMRYMQTGAPPGTDDEVVGWTPIYNRDLAANNIFIHYPARDASEVEPEEGFQDNAFPEVVLGDFGHAAVEGDIQRRLRMGRWNQYTTESWHDTYGAFSVVKKLCLCHVADPEYDEGFAPENVPCDNINQYMGPNDSPYSDDLLNTLKNWEYEDCENSYIDSTREDDNGNDIPNATLIPDLRFMIDTVLPLARGKVRRYRRPGGNKPDDWYRQLDVSWTKPKRLMPYEWRPIEAKEVKVPANSEEDSDSGGDDKGYPDWLFGGSKSDNNPNNPDDDLDPNLSGIINSSNLINNNTNQTGGSQNDGSQGDDGLGDNNPDGNNSDGNNPDGDGLDDDGAGGDGAGDDDPGGNDPDNNNSDNGAPGVPESPSSLDSSEAQESSIHSGYMNTTKHKCATPNPLTERDKLIYLTKLENDYPALRPPHRVVMLSYEVPMMYDIRDIPDGPGPDLPDSPPPTPPDSDNSDGDGGDGAGGSGRGGKSGGRGGRGGRGGKGGGRGGSNNSAPSPPPPPQPTRRSVRTKGRFQGSYKTMLQSRSKKTTVVLDKVYTMTSGDGPGSKPPKKKRKVGGKKKPVYMQ